MNIFEILLIIGAVLVLAVLIVIRDAISVDGAKARLAIADFGARVRGLFKRGA